MTIEEVQQPLKLNLKLIGYLNQVTVD